MHLSLFVGGQGERLQAPCPFAPSADSGVGILERLAGAMQRRRYGGGKIIFLKVQLAASGCKSLQLTARNVGLKWLQEGVRGGSSGLLFVAYRAAPDWHFRVNHTSQK